jgi:preprotein translocase subunit SecD
MPNITDHLPAWWGSVFSTEAINLGLDLQGGIHMVLEVEVDKAVENRVDLVIEQLRADARDQEIATRDWKRTGIDSLTFELISRSRRQQLDELVANDYPGLEAVGDADGRMLSFRIIEPEIERIREFAVDQALETIRNRVDEFGVAEPTIQRTGTRGILIQLPGVQDPERAKSLIGRTAQLQFQLVEDDPSAAGTVVLSGVASAQTYRLQPTVLMTG